MTISKAKTFRNVIYTTLTKGTTIVCIAVTAGVVARNLSPSDYGVVGFALIIMNFLFHFSDMGVFTAAIQRRTLDQQSLRSAFTLRVMLSSGAFVAAQLVAPLAHHLFEHPAITNVVRLASFNYLATMIGFMSFIMLTREHNFRALVIPGVAGSVARTILAVTLVLLGWKYWAVVLADLGANLTSSVAMQLVRKIPIRFEVDWADFREFLRIGTPSIGGGLLVFLILNMDNFLVGLKMGSAKLGYYALAFSWGAFICGFLSDTVNSVMLPAFSAMQDDTAAMRRWYLKSVDMAGFVAVVANTALLANGRFFLVTFLGKGTGKWLPVTTPLKILCIYGILRVITEPLTNCIVARGRTKLLLGSGALAGVAELLLILLVLPTGRIDLIAAAVLVAYATQAIIYLPFLRKEFSIGFGDLAAKLWPVIPALLGGCAITSLLPEWLGGTLFTLGCRGLFTAAVTALIHGLCTRFRCFQEAGGMISQNLDRVLA
jgi:lipopolysaccharide exporter